MKAIPFERATAEDNYRAPDYWINFTADILPYEFRDTDNRKKRKLRVAAWLRDVNTKLLDYGGRLQRKEDGHYILTFRLDSNYTFFVLKYSYTPKEHEWF